jgi:ATP-dependent DNA ligase
VAFELKYDGFRGLAHIRSGKYQLISRNGNPFPSFADLAASIAASLPGVQDAVLDGEIVCLDRLRCCSLRRRDDWAQAGVTPPYPVKK